MPIRPEHRLFYPIDWPQLSDAIRFRRAQGRCEECARPHLQRVFHLGDGQGRQLRQRQRLRDEDLLARVRITKRCPLRITYLAAVNLGPYCCLRYGIVSDLGSDAFERER